MQKDHEIRNGVHHQKSYLIIGGISFEQNNHY
jgi:hypothetical protein